MKKLYLSSTDKKMAGVVGGLSEYFDIDSTLLRVIWALVVVFTGIFPGVIVYILAWLVMPTKPKEKHNKQKIAEDDNKSPQD
ncbi:MAG: PspC domain-containing protein [Candidatus Spechtbacterales bacterium]|nr:PspC domain-containing protein [Candidatus Spechtbacterales bacterium]